MSLLTNVLKLWRTGQYLLPADSGFSPKHLLAGGRVGWWLDPLDFRYARQDSAGATAYTAVEQGVGMAVDKSANGLTFVQASAPAKPVVSARVNLLTNTALSGFVAGSPGTPPTGWANSQVTGDIAAGTSGGLKFILNNTRRTITQIPTVLANTSYLYRIKVNVIVPHAKFYPSNILRPIFAGATISSFSWSIDGAAFTAGSEVLSTGVHTVVMRLDVGATGGGVYFAFGSGAVDAVGAVGEIDMWEPQVVLLTRANLPYQYVNTATDYDTVGFSHSLKFDGAATNLVAASGGGATTGFYFGAAVQFGKVGAVQTIVSDAGTNTGFKIRTTAANQIEISAGNGAAFTAVNTTEAFAAGDVAFIELSDNGTNLSACLGNGTPATVARPAVSAGTAQMTLGKANNAASEYSGVSIYSAVYLKDYCPTAAERADYKRWALQRAGVAS